MWSGQHLEHIAQRQEAPTHSTPYLPPTLLLLCCHHRGNNFLSGTQHTQVDCQPPGTTQVDIQGMEIGERWDFNRMETADKEDSDSTGGRLVVTAWTFARVAMSIPRDIQVAESGWG